MGRRIMGDYYATAIARRPGSEKRYGRAVARQARTVEEARAALDATGQRGYVQKWNQRTQQRDIICERDEAGNWTTFDPFSGNVHFID